MSAYPKTYLSASADIRDIRFFVFLFPALLES